MERQDFQRSSDKSNKTKMRNGIDKDLQLFYLVYGMKCERN